MANEQEILNQDQAEENTINIRLAKVEGRLASSWFSYTREEYEKNLKETFKQETFTTIIRWIIGTMIFLSGAGYLFIKSLVVDVYDTKNKLVIEDLNNRYENLLKQEKRRFEWQRNHNAANNYIQLAEYVKSSLIDSTTKEDAIKRAFKKADQYFNYALRYDKSQGTTYWELGELYFTYPNRFGVPYFKNQEKALEYYELAEKVYNDFEISQGWRADAQKMIGIIYFDKLLIENDLDKKKCITTKQEIILIKQKKTTKIVYLSLIQTLIQD